MSTRAALMGTAASPGSSTGPLVVLRDVVVELPEFDDPAKAVADAMPQVAAGLMARSTAAAERGQEEAAAVLQAQSFMAEDPMLADAIEGHLSSGAALDRALQQASDELEAMMAALPDPYLAARSADVAEVATALRFQLAGVETGGPAFDEPSILVARTLTAAQTADLDPARVLGFVTELGGPTSHVAIIARSLGVPAIVALTGAIDAADAAGSAAMDGSSGEFILDPTADDQADFAERSKRMERIAEWARTAHGTAATFDGAPVAVAANVARVEDIAEGVDTAADGVGLFRTEFLFLDRSKPPTEEEQYTAYRAAAEGFEHQVVIRAFDIGGDKPAEFLDIEEEENPFLGIRGVRLYEDFTELFDLQVRACLRAAAHGPLALMIPMVATIHEMRWVRERVAQVQAALEAEGAEYGTVPLGVMIEVPSLALTAAAVASEVDFFSIGTNDLTQYTLAADRAHAALGGFQDPLHPSVLALCRMTVLGAAQHGRSVSVCGLAAADPVAASVFAALGVDKLSVTPSAVNLIKATVSAQQPSLRAAVLAAIEQAGDSAQLREMIEGELVLP